MVRDPQPPRDVPADDAPEVVFGADAHGPAGPDGLLAVVTGASGLLGSSMAVELARRGWRVVVLGRDPEDLEAASGAVAAAVPSGRVAGLQCDLTTAEDVDAAAEFVERLDRPVGLLVHAAGLQASATVTTSPVEDLDEHYLLNVRGPYLLSQRLVPLMAPGASHCVVFAASPVAGRGDAHHGITAAALVAFAAELRAEVAPRGVKVVTVHTDDDPAVSTPEPVVPGVRGGVAEQVAALARTVLDALDSDDVDLTGLRVRVVPHPVRSERR